MDLNKSDRKASFTLRAEKIGVDPVIIEKDFWVVFTLHHLFSSKIPVGFVFKGGTSLSKCYNLIKRFSEDIDITINRADLGFDIGYEELMKKSRKSRDRFLKDIKVASEAFISTTILSNLNDSFCNSLKESFQLAIDNSDKQ